MKNVLLPFITLILQVLQAIARATFYHINALSDIEMIYMKDLLLLFMTLIFQVLQATTRATFYHINALSDICKIAIKIKQDPVFHATKSVKLICHQLHR